MALTFTGKLLLAVSVVVALVALLFPTEWLDGHKKLKGSSKCPLGYDENSGVAIPSNHPPVIRNSSPKGRRLYFNAHVWTGCAEVPLAKGILVNEDGSIERIIVGDTDSQQALGHVEEQVDLQGQHIVPGFIDPHLHLIPGGQSLAQINLATAHSPPDFQRLVQEGASQLPVGQWLLGGSWDDQLLGMLPQASWLDEAVGERCALLLRSDLHMAVASSAALREAGIDATTPDPPHGVIDRGEDGTPTGVLRERAIDLVASRVPAATADQRRAALLAAQRHLLAAGITAVGDMGVVPMAGNLEGSWRDLQDVLLPAANDGSLIMRVAAYLPLSTWSRLAAMRSSLGPRHPGGRLYWGGLKAFADGSLGSRTALMHEPYTDDPAASGVRAQELRDMKEAAAAANREGLQVAVHAIGDCAVDEVLGMLREVVTREPQCQKCSGGRRRHRIEHVQHIAGERSVAALATGPVQLVMNPVHMLADRGLLLPRLGQERAGWAFAVRSLMSSGAQVAFGSDWPVAEANPLLGCFAAAFRTTPGVAEAPHSPEQRISMEEALRAHTVAAARSLLLDDRIGLLRSGYRADFVVLSGSPFLDSDKGQLPAVRQTYVDGVCVHGCLPPAA